MCVLLCEKSCAVKVEQLSSAESGSGARSTDPIMVLCSKNLACALPQNLGIWIPCRLLVPVPCTIPHAPSSVYFWRYNEARVLIFDAPAVSGPDLLLTVINAQLGSSSHSCNEVVFHRPRPEEGPISSPCGASAQEMLRHLFGQFHLVMLVRCTVYNVRCAVCVCVCVCGVRVRCGPALTSTEGNWTTGNDLDSACDVPGDNILISQHFSLLTRDPLGDAGRRSHADGSAAMRRGLRGSNPQISRRYV